MTVALHASPSPLWRAIIPHHLASRGVYEAPYTMEGKIVLIAIGSTGAYLGHELVIDEDEIACAEKRLWKNLDRQDPLTLTLSSTG